MRKFQCLLFVLKQSHIYYIICTPLSLRALNATQIDNKPTPMMFFGAFDNGANSTMTLLFPGMVSFSREISII